MYHVTAYDNEGKKLLDEPLQAESDAEAREKGLSLLAEKEYLQLPYRIVHTSGRLVAFNSHKGKGPQ
ncbi:YhzD-like protein [Planifilum fulgidum]|jgi:hypothetical protein|uniref:YhzD-like protein n=1 Tax=Planifilum fulgidum TaxID=201973 RepID=A0A1I2Q0X4_9BACL|nr:YhzD family protein [Planifilum fulgidum]MBO2496839.1 hypothetical protein [Bacillota bacterium]MBO2532722.1 hypothetical protein [Thermoactinomycetaceae bacterium]SFG21994.1 YhzD-like protein [Planifilum fulgidum]